MVRRGSNLPETAQGELEERLQTEFDGPDRVPVLAVYSKDVVGHYGLDGLLPIGDGIRQLHIAETYMMGDMGVRTCCDRFTDLGRQLLRSPVVPGNGTAVPCLRSVEAGIPGVLLAQSGPHPVRMRGECVTSCLVYQPHSLLDG